MEKLDMPWRQFIGKQDLYKLYNFSGIPFTLVIDKEGNIDNKWFHEAVLNAAHEKGFQE